MLSLKKFTQAEDILSHEPKLISPGVTFKHAWVYHEKLTGLQDDINRVIHEVQTAVSDVLANSTKTTLQQYEDHVDDILDEYLPALELFNELNPSMCRNSAERILKDTTEFTGFGASNCADSYDIRVRRNIAEANNALQSVDNLYSQVQTIVVRAFIAQNHFVDPEAIEDTITVIFDVVEGRWITAKPGIEEVRRNLATSIAVQNAELGNCHNEILVDAKMTLAHFNRVAQTCIDFDNSQNPLDSKSRFGRPSEDYIAQMEEFEIEFAKLKPYQWQA